MREEKKLPSCYYTDLLITSSLDQCKEKKRIKKCPCREREYLLAFYYHNSLMRKREEGSQCSGMMFCAPLALSTRVSRWIALLVWALLLFLWARFMANRALTD